MRGLYGPYKLTRPGPVTAGRTFLVDQTVKPINTTRYSLLLPGRRGRSPPAFPS